MIGASQRPLTRAGVAAWSIVGIAVLTSIVVSVLAAISELVLPLVFAVMIGATAYPLARRLHRRMSPALAALVVVSGMGVVVAAVAVLTIEAVASQTGTLSAQVDTALAELATSGVGLDDSQLQQVREAVASLSALITRGVLTLVIGGIGALIGFVAAAILGTLIMYYVLKDGPELRRWFIRQFAEGHRAEVSSFLSDAVGSVRGYWSGRTVLSAIITSVIVVVSLVLGLPLIITIAVVNFLGGYVPYIGGFIGGGLVVLLALADGGVIEALIVLVIVLACNLVLENVIEPRVMSSRLRIHPLVVLLATTTGGVVGGIVGLVLAVPVTVVSIDLFRRLRAAGTLSTVRARAAVVAAAEAVRGPD